MAKIVDHGQIRRILLNSTVKTVAKYGMENCTSKRISIDSKLNEAYIFRYYIDLRDIRANAFESVINNWLYSLNQLSTKYKNDIDDESKRKQFFTEFWNRLISDPNEVTFFIRYYHSQEFDEMPSDISGKINQLMRKSFFPNTSESAICNTGILESFLIISEQLTFVFRGLVPDNQETIENAYRILYI